MTIKMSDVKQVKVDNWGIYFLQRLKHFFNRTDYCDLTLQFQDNAQLKVHRLVLSACTEYFELLERTCEMYEDCLVMPDDLQADVVVPIVNFMYTGQLEFKMELLERLYQTSLVMNMPVLSKLLYTHRQQSKPPVHSYSKQVVPKPSFSKSAKGPVASSSGLNNKRTFSKAFEQSSVHKPKKVFHSQAINKPEMQFNNSHNSEPTFYNFPVISDKNRNAPTEPRPTRYELPEELDEDNIFDNSFTNISYTSKPLMIHPNSVKQYSSKTTGLFEDASTSKRFFHTSSSDIVECRKISSSSNVQHANIFEDETLESLPDENEMFQQSLSQKDVKNASQLFDQILDNDGPKLTIEASDSKQANNIDHAKIISEVLKKYPHFVKSNKNIKLKILNTSKTKKKGSFNSPVEETEVNTKQEPDFTYESDVIDSKQAAMLIALGAENVKGPWICLICGTPGKALHFTSYFKFRRHLVEVHNEKPIPNMCEYCGIKSLKRNCLLYHLYTKHGVPPPSNYRFPKCNYCNYIALTEALLVKHKMSHADNRLFRCNVCAATYTTSSQLLGHIQKTGHKYSDKKTNLQCIYCLKVFMREANLYAHLKTSHKRSARNDGIIDDSDEDNEMENIHPSQKSEITNQELSKNSKSSILVKAEVPVSFENTFEECNIQYQIEQKSDGNIQVVSRKPKVLMPVNKHKILNSGLSSQTLLVNSPSKGTPKKKLPPEPSPDQSEFLPEMETDSPIPSNNSEEIVIIDNQEFIVQNYQLVPKREMNAEEYVMPNAELDESTPALPTSSHLEYHTFHSTQPEASKMIVKKSNVNQSIQIVVSNEEEYKALMNSNHSIIFDNSDANKTLTVLAGPNDRQLDTNAIDLDNAPSNDMMIIPEAYPINVSESVSADSSNIVVVYSHPVDDHNKQYQIITSQALDTQFVQPSSIITQNFETVTTCSPEINSHMLNTQVVDSWQSTIQGNITKLPISCASGIQTMHVPSSMEVSAIGNLTTSNIEELPEVTISQPINISQIVTSPNNTSINLYNQPHIIEQTVLVPSDNTVTHNITVTDQQQQTETPLTVLNQNEIVTEIQMHDNNIIDHSAMAMPSMDSNSISENNTLCENSANLSTDLNISDSVIVSNEQTIISQAIVSNEQTIISQVESSPSNENEINNLSDENVNNNIQTSSSSELLPPNTTPDFDKSYENTTNDIVEHNSEEESRQEDLNVNQNISEMSETIDNIAKDIDAYPQSIHNEHTQVIEITNNNLDISDGDKSVVNENVESVIMKNISTEREIREDIVTLASEWSEEETDTQTETMELPQEPQETDARKDERIEESIENIQHEINSQMSLNEGVETSVENEEPIAVQEPTKENLTDQKFESPQVNNEIIKNPQEKISSLLNDWDDNDSQEEDSGNTEKSPVTNKTTDENLTMEVNDTSEVIEVNNCSVIVEPELKKDDKIKSLVSDWDEEDEEEVKD